MPGLTLIDAGRVTLTAAVHDKTICLALGSGDPAWSVPPPNPPNSATALVAPIAMVRASQKSFVVQAAGDAGAIKMADGTSWDVAPGKSRFLYVQFTLGFADGPSDQYRELALYLGSTFAAGIPAGQNYIPWASVTAPGDLLALERFNMIDGAGTRETFGRLMTF